MIRKYFVLLLLNSVALLMSARAIDADAVRQSLKSSDAGSQLQALKLLAEDVQSSISGTAGQSISDILAPARQRMTPFKPEILALTSSSDAKVRAMVGYLLPLLPQGPEIDQALVKLADDPDTEVTATAVASLAAVPQLSKESRSAVLKVIREKSSVTALRFATDVALKNQMDEAIPLLASALNDQNPTMQIEAVKSLARFKSKARGQLEALKHIEAKSENDTVKAAVKSAIQEIK